MKWFKHDSSAHIDARIKKVKHKYGIIGYGLYWYCIELIAMGIDAKNITFTLEEDAETISLEWGLDQLKVQEMMAYMVSLGLFENDSSGRITCMKLAKRLDDTNSKNPEVKKILAKLYGEDGKSVGETPSNSDNLPPEENRLEENRLDNNTPARPKLTKADKLVQKVRQNPEKFVCLNCVDDELLTEWARLRVKKNASDSDRALNKIESVLETLRTSMDIAPDQAIARQCDRGWTTVELEYFQNSKPANTMPAAQSNQETLSQVSMRTL